MKVGDKVRVVSGPYSDKGATGRVVATGYAFDWRVWLDTPNEPGAYNTEELEVIGG